MPRSSTRVRPKLLRALLLRVAETAGVAVLAGATAVAGRHLIENRPSTRRLSPEVRTRIEHGEAPAFGSRTPKVTIVEFADFECPYCAVQAASLRRLAPSAAARSVRVEFHNYPLSIHPWAAQAARLAWCTNKAAPQIFWAAYDYLFSHQREIDRSNLRETFVRFLNNSSVSSAPVLRCARSELASRAVAADESLAQAAGVTATPTLFINGRMHVGVFGYPQLESAIAAETRWTRFIPFLDSVH